MLLWVCTVMDQNMVGASMTHFAVPLVPRCCPYQILRSSAKSVTEQRQDNMESFCQLKVIWSRGMKSEYWNLIKS